MKIAFLTRHDPTNINCWSGTLYHMYHKLKERHMVEIIGMEILPQFLFFTKDNFPTNFFIPADRNIQLLGRLLSERINLLNYDLIFLGDIFFILSNIKIPYVLLSDMTYEQNIIHYNKPDERNIESCINLEKRILGNAFRIIYCSEWIKRKTIDYYQIDPRKIDVVEFGANIPTPTNYAVEINMDICRLLFIGKDWERKGGDKMIQTYKILKKGGFPCSLTIIGSGNNEIDDDVEWYYRLSFFG